MPLFLVYIELRKKQHRRAVKKCQHRHTNTMTSTVSCAVSGFRQLQYAALGVDSKNPKSIKFEVELKVGCHTRSYSQIHQKMFFFYVRRIFSETAEKHLNNIIIIFEGAYNSVRAPFFIFWNLVDAVVSPLACVFFYSVFSFFCARRSHRLTHRYKQTER